MTPRGDEGALVRLVENVWRAFLNVLIAYFALARDSWRFFFKMYQSMSVLIDCSKGIPSIFKEKSKQQFNE